MTVLKRIFGNKWVKFGLVTTLYVLWFVVWSRNLWWLFGVPVIYDIYISKYLYRWFWKKHKERKAVSKTYREVSGWIEAIVFAVIVASLIHIYVFQMYRIPSSSMEKSLLVGDYLCVSKIAYGPRMPNTPVAFPLVHHTMPFSRTKKSFSEIIRLPYKRLKGLGDVQRNDIVVFNFPAGDTVLLENQAVTYYDVLREFQNAYGDREGREELNRRFTVISRPVDKREHYVKRCVGMPGDTLRIISSQLLINGEPQEDVPGRQYLYFIRTTGTPISRSVLEKMGISKDDISYNREARSYTLPLTDENLAKIKAMKNVVEVIKYEATETGYVFPHDERYPWNEDNFGPLWIPRKGATVTLTEDNLPLYRRIIEIYEGNQLDVKEDGIYINGNRTDSYTFNMNYYFMMGDNRHNSADSRFWGFVPEDHIVGKPSFVWFSRDKDKRFPSNIRWGRMFRGV